MNPFLKHALLLWPTLVVLAPALLTDNTWTFRDGGHFHRPLFDWIERQSRHDENPLWNPQDGLGAPVAGDATSALFYPGRIVATWLPVSNQLRYELYVAAHLIGCSLAAAWLAKRWGTSDEASVVAGLAYSMGGHVVFQVHNVPFLIGAAWLPASLAGFWDIAQGRRVLGATIAAPALAMAVLGGDPQSAVHAVFAGAVFAFFRLREDGRWIPLKTMASLATVAGVAVFAIALSAVQVAPAIEHAATSVRAFEPNDPAALEFEVPLWRWIEFVIPNAGGRLFPFHERWGQAVGIEGRVWSPSLYLGAIPALAIVAGFFAGARVNSAGPSRWCLAALAAFAMLAALGGPVYEALRWLPGYGAFRYPAKWAVFGAAPLAMLAAYGWDAAVERPDFFRGLAVAFLGLVVVGSLFLLVLPASRVVENSPVFGPFDWERVAYATAFAALEATLMSVAVLAVWPLRDEQEVFQPTFGVALFVLGADLIVANTWLLPTTPAPATFVFDREKHLPPPRSRRDIQDSDAFPRWWSQLPDEDRLADLARWERDTFAGKTHLRGPMANVDSQWSLRPIDLLAFREVSRTIDDPRGGAACWGVEQVRTANSRQPLFRDLRGKAVVPRAWVARHALARPLSNVRSTDDAHRVTRETILALDGSPRDLVNWPVVETDSRVDLGVTHQQWASDGPKESLVGGEDTFAPASITEYHNDLVRVGVEQSAPGLLVLADWHAPGWTAVRIAADGSRVPAPILRVNRLLRGVELPAGSWTVEFRYDPATVRVGRWVSIAAWIAWAIVAWVVARRAKTERAAA